MVPRTEGVSHQAVTKLKRHHGECGWFWIYTCYVLSLYVNLRPYDLRAKDVVCIKDALLCYVI
jgi:hypothetical protein